MSDMGEQLGYNFQKSGSNLSGTASAYTNGQGAILGGMAAEAAKVGNAIEGGNKQQIADSLIEAANRMAEMRKVAANQIEAVTGSKDSNRIQEKENQIEMQRQGMIAEIMAWSKGEMQINPLEGFKNMIRTAMDGSIPQWLHEMKM